MHRIWNDYVSIYKFGASTKYAIRFKTNLYRTEKAWLGEQKERVCKPFIEVKKQLLAPKTCWARLPLLWFQGNTKSNANTKNIKKQANPSIGNVQRLTMAYLYSQRQSQRLVTLWKSRQHSWWLCQCEACRLCTKICTVTFWSLKNCLSPTLSVHHHLKRIASVTVTRCADFWLKSLTCKG